MKLLLHTLLLLALSTSSLWAQTDATIIEHTFDWSTDNAALTFEGASHAIDAPELPLFVAEWPLADYADLTARILEVEYAPQPPAPALREATFAERLSIQAQTLIARREAIAKVSFVPIIKTAAGYQRVTRIKLAIEATPATMPRAKTRRTGFNSVLADGTIHKIAIAETGIYRLSYDYLKNTVGLDIDKIDPRTIKIYGNGGGTLPERNSDPRIDDLAENAIQIIGENDGSFDPGDYLLMYAQGPTRWQYDPATGRYALPQNPYDTRNHYFIKVSPGTGKRITTQAPTGTPTYVTSTGDGRWHYEQDLVNLLDQFIYASASGREWYGDSFKFTTDRTYNFTLPQLVTSEPITATIRVAGRSVNVNNNFEVFANGQSVANLIIGGVNGNTESYFARSLTRTATFNSLSANVDLRLVFNRSTSNAEGWLDFITVQARQTLNFTGGQMGFRDRNSIGEPLTTFQLVGPSANWQVWDITSPTDAQAMALTPQQGNNYSFNVVTDTLREFWAFDESQLLQPEYVGAVANQNLHGGMASPPNLVIIYHPDFEQQALRLASHRAAHSNMVVETVTIQEVYNEFSSGNADVTAIRDFARYLYNEYPNAFRYLLLFGDGSFDYRNIKNSPTNQNFIPVYETQASTHPIIAYTSDDYHALLDPNEGNIESGAMDIGIGRLPVRTAAEATSVVDKIIRYDTDARVLGDWKNRVTFVADDEDGNLHLDDADEIARATQSMYPALNLDKIYLDAYPQVSTHGGTRIPAVTEALHSNMFKGNFVVNYMGHGGEDGWAQERVLQIPHIQSWQNTHKLPLFVTATCSFAPYDDPSINSAGELVLLKPDGGAIALFTTVRAVYTTSNKRLTRAVFDNLYNQTNGEYWPIGELLRYAKNTSGAGVANSRKFTLLGDPSQTLAYPRYGVVTTHINGAAVSGADTLRALEQITIEGYVSNADSSVLTGFNGIIYPVVYDKRAVFTTLGQDLGSYVRNYTLQKAVLFKGRASVVNGKFSFSFIVPRDINYAFGEGKISYYADDGTALDAAGQYNGIIIGGTNPNVIADDQGPKVEVFMNDASFVFGGMTDESPTLYVRLSDDNGINTTGTGIGHDITSVLDENTQQTYVMNDFYESAVDDFTSGEVRYPLADLEEGRHHIKVKAWDVANNSGEGETEFVVTTSAEIALKHVLNYPNPFTTRTEFQFEHNKPDQPLIVQVQIFSASGRLVKTIQQEVQSEGYRVTGITWNGLDDFGNNIGRGVYLYKVSVGMMGTDGQLTSESAFEKLVILK